MISTAKYQKWKPPLKKTGMMLTALNIKTIEPQISLKIIDQPTNQAEITINIKGQPRDNMMMSTINIPKIMNKMETAENKERMRIALKSVDHIYMISKPIQWITKDLNTTEYYILFHIFSKNNIGITISIIKIIMKGIPINTNKIMNILSMSTIANLSKMSILQRCRKMITKMIA